MRFLPVSTGNYWWNFYKQLWLCYCQIKTRGISPVIRTHTEPWWSLRPEQSPQNPTRWEMWATARVLSTDHHP